MPDSGNHKIAQDIRGAANTATAQQIHDLMLQAGTIGGILKATMRVAADIIDIYEEGGVNLDEWPQARSLCELIAGGGLFAPGTPPPPPKPQLLVAKGNATAMDKKLKRGAQ